MTKKLQKQITELINKKARVGMVLTLGDRILKCVEALETDRGTRYMFDNGSGWTKSNIESNIILTISKGNEWGIA